MLNITEDRSALENTEEEVLSRFDARKSLFLNNIKKQANKNVYSKTIDPISNYVVKSKSRQRPMTSASTLEVSEVDQNTERTGPATERIALTKETRGKKIPRRRSFFMTKRESTNLSDFSDDRFSDDLKSSDSLVNRNKFSFRKTQSFNKHIMSIVRINRQKGKSAKDKILLPERETNLNVFQKVNILRYRENVFKAASQLSASLPPFPVWAYKNKKESKSNILKFNISGTLFEVYDDTIMNLPHTKLAENYLYHSRNSTMYFDRDASCFNAVLNFYRTGRLHAPASSCLSFFHEELLFWGINEDLMEPCCYSDYQTNKKNCDNLEKYMDSMKKPLRTYEKITVFRNARRKYKMISISEHSGVFTRWYVFFYTSAIVITLLTMIFGTTDIGRVDKVTNKMASKLDNESFKTYFMRTDVNYKIRTLDIFLNTFFLVDFLTRFIVSYDRLTFFSDIINWTDLLVIIASILSDMPMIIHAEHYETYPLLLKVPRIFRIFRLSKNIRMGMDAFILTLQASSTELMLVLIITFIAICFYGVLIYVVEMVHEGPNRPSSFKTIYEGMWWAIVTMATIGYGDFVPQSSHGYIVGYFSILTGIIITQLPVPIFLKNFSILYNQIQARMQLVDTAMRSNVHLDTVEQSNIQTSSLKSSTKNNVPSEEGTK